MSISKKVYLTITNDSNEDFKVSVNEADGKLLDKDKIPNTLKKNTSMTIKARRSATLGPKLDVYLEATSDSQKKILVYCELSIDEDNSRCCYAIPDKDYVFEGCRKCYWFQSSNQKDFYTEVTIGKMYKANTFYHISDTHIEKRDNVSVEEEYNWQKILLRAINEDSTAQVTIDGESVVIGDILGILHTGDIFSTFSEEDDFAPYFNNVYKKIYKRPDKKSKKPVNENDILFTHLFEGVGNHDDTCAGNHKIEVWDDVLNRSDRKWKNNDDTVDSRMPSVEHRSGADIRHKRCHYRWMWRGVHFIQVNFAVADGMYEACEKYTTYVYNSLDYLEEELKKINSNMPVIICCHLGGESNDFYSDESINKFKEVMQKNKNIVAVLHGHTHQEKLQEIKIDETRNVPFYDAGKGVGGIDNGERKYCFLKYTFNEGKNSIEVIKKSFEYNLKNNTYYSKKEAVLGEISLDIKA